jgi:hypothetical protein
MPYIAFELDAMERAPEVARAIGLSVGDTAWGLLQMWRWCWREKTDLVSAVHLQGFFGSASAGAALEAFGFTEAAGVYFRVRGAARYLKIAEAKSKGGKASVGNLKRGNEPGASRKTSPAPPRLPPGRGPGSAPALSASSDERQATNDVNYLAGEPAEPKFPKPPKVPKPPDPPPNPRHNPLVKALTDVYAGLNFGAKYDFQPRDAAHVAQLLAKSDDDDEILFRWRVALEKSADKFHTPKTRTLSDLVRDWNAYPVVKGGQRNEEMRL